MPYFRWQGIDIEGTIHSGMRFAKSHEDLEQYLICQGIGLMHIDRPKRLTFRPLGRQAKVDFFRQCAVLLDAGVSLPKALSLLAHQIHHKQFQEALSDISRDVQEGISLSDSLTQHEGFFTGPMISIIQAGQESGSLNQALHKLAHYLETVDELKKKIRAAILMPCITFTLFLIIAMIIFLVIMPSFAAILQATGQAVPHATQRLFALSDFLKTQRAFWTGFAILFI
ncbi:MAG: type II secretion system F family protein, partial [Candidatus Babeliales bacterium]